MIQAETRLQLSIMRWWAYAHHAYKVDERTLFHCPNGGKRGKVEACIMKGMGVRAGVPDLLAIVARNGYHGLAIELKSCNGTISPNQTAMLALFEAQGWKTAICFSFDEAIKAIDSYLKL